MRLIRCEDGKAREVSSQLWNMKKTDYRVSQIRDTNEFKHKLSNGAEIEGYRLFVVLVGETREAMADVVHKIESLPYVRETREWAWKQGIDDAGSMP